MSVDRIARLARLWSNGELRRIAPLLAGAIVNVSAGDDADKEGGVYQTYFTRQSSYHITNYAPGSFRGYRGRDNELLLDLTQDLPLELHGRFDVAFSHTTLEHVFEIDRAFRNFCQLTTDVAITVVPFSQVEHPSESFGDYWRFTPQCIRRLFELNGLHVLYDSANNDFNSATYIFSVASRTPDKWRHHFPVNHHTYLAGEWIGKRRARLSRLTTLPPRLRLLFSHLFHRQPRPGEAAGA